MKAAGLDDGLNSPSIKRLRDRLDLKPEEFLEKMATEAVELVAGKRRIVWPGDGTVEFVER